MFVWSDPVCEELFNKLLAHEEQFPIFTVEDNIQEIKHVSWKNVFDIIQSKHWHHTEKATCPHAESLFEHLCRCAELCYEEAIRRELENPHLYFYTGLLHDVGKPGTLRIRGKYTSFKGHGLVGGSLILHLWSEKLGDALGLTFIDWGAISTATDVHMCGYFPDMCEPQQLDSFRLLSFSVRLLIQVLRIGDCGSLIPMIDEENIRKEELKKVFETQDMFIEKTTIPILNYAEKYNLTNGVLIQLQGASGSGKSTLRTYIKNQLNGCNIVEVVRDDVMVETSFKDQGLDPVKNYTPEQYRSCYDHYQKRKEVLSKRVNSKMMTQIQEALLQGYVVITDTLATAYSLPAMNILPKKEVKSAFKVSFWCSRGPELFTDENSLNRHGMTSETQIKIHGERNLMNPLRNLDDFASVTSITETPKAKIIEKKDWIRPHFSLSTNWNNIKRREIKTILDHVKLSYKYCQSLPRKLIFKTSQDYSLRELVEILFNSGGVDEVKDFFSRYAYQVSVNSDHIVGIKYIDGMNRIWRSSWAREARGRFYYYDSEKRHVIPLKETLQRGAEILTSSHKNVDETQDMSSKEFDHLDDTQQELISLLRSENDEPITGILSCKVDGMLLVLNFYPISCEQYQVMQNMVTTSKMHLFLSDKTLVVPSTQGTLFAGETVFDYIITAFCGEMNIDVPDTTPLKAWKALETSLRSWLETLYNAINMKDKMLNMTAEMICKNRTTYRGNVHTELAVNYDASYVAFLGVYYDGKYIPHSDLPNTREFITHPGYISISSTKQIQEAVQDLENVIVEGRSLSEFAEKWFKNKETPVHAEGFVYLHKTRSGAYDYSKIKLPVYYMLHKIKKENIQTLLALPNTVDSYFPSLTALRKFEYDLKGMMINLADRLGETVTDFLTGEKKDAFLQTLNERARARMDKYFNNKENMKADEIKAIYAICTREGLDHFKEKFVKLAFSIFGQLNDAIKRDSVVVLCVDLLLKTCPWLGKEHVEKTVVSLLEKKDKIINTVWFLFVATPA